MDAREFREERTNGMRISSPLERSLSCLSPGMEI